METFEQLAQRGELHLLREIAEAALTKYGLPGVELTLISGGETALVKIVVPSRFGDCVHPYLGRTGGKQFVLRIDSSGEYCVGCVLREVAGLLALCRDTDLVVPEPVPSWDGSLVVEVAPEGVAGASLCVLFRWSEEPLFEVGLIPELAYLTATGARA